MARSSAAYQARCPADWVLYQIVRDHYETFAVRAASWGDGAGLPPFIDKKFRGVLRCGHLAARPVPTDFLVFHDELDAADRNAVNTHRS